MGESPKIGEIDIAIKDDKKTVVELTVEQNENGEWVILDQEVIFEDILLGTPTERAPSEWESNKILQEKMPALWTKYFKGESQTNIKLRKLWNLHEIYIHHLNIYGEWAVDPMRAAKKQLYDLNLQLLKSDKYETSVQDKYDKTKFDGFINDFNSGKKGYMNNVETAAKRLIAELRSPFFLKFLKEGIVKDSAWEDTEIIYFLFFHRLNQSAAGIDYLLTVMGFVDDAGKRENREQIDARLARVLELVENPKTRSIEHFAQVRTDPRGDETNYAGIFNLGRGVGLTTFAIVAEFFTTVQTLFRGKAATYINGTLVQRAQNELKDLDIPQDWTINIDSKRVTKVGGIEVVSEIKIFKSADQLSFLKNMDITKVQIPLTYLLNLANLSLIIYSFKGDGKSYLAMGSAVATLVDNVLLTFEKFEKSFFIISRKAASGVVRKGTPLAIVAGVFDTVVAADNAWEKYYKGDIDSAVFELVGVAGNAMMTAGVFIFLAGIQSEATVYGIPLGILLNVLGVVITLIGAIFAYVLEDTPIDYWINHNYFSKRPLEEWNYKYVEWKYGEKGKQEYKKEKKFLTALEKQIRAFQDIVYKVEISYETRIENGKRLYQFEFSFTNSYVTSQFTLGIMAFYKEGVKPLPGGAEDRYYISYPYPEGDSSKFEFLQFRENEIRLKQGRSITADDFDTKISFQKEEHRVKKMTLVYESNDIGLNYREFHVGLGLDVYQYGDRIYTIKNIFK